jgi:hypothetical protein
MNTNEHKLSIACRETKYFIRYFHSRLFVKIRVHSWRNFFFLNSTYHFLLACMKIAGHALIETLGFEAAAESAVMD